MKLSVNSKEKETRSGTLQELAQELELPAQGVAVAVGNRMVPRNEWERYTLAEGMQIVIIKAACGG